MEGVLIGILTEACEDFFFYVLHECEANGIHANANTDAVYNNFVSGSMTYNFQNSSYETTVRTADFTISSGMSDLTFLDDGVIRWQSGVYDADTPTVNIYQSNGQIDIIVSNSSLQCYIDNHLIDVSNYITYHGLLSTTYTANYGYNGSDYWFSPENGLGGREALGRLSDVRLTSSSAVASAFSNAVYVPSPVDGSLNYDEFLIEVVEWASENYPEETITIDDLPSWEELASEETESETGGSCCGCSCTTIYVNADGSLTLQNEISGDLDLAIDNEADLSLNINAAAGAFGAGAIVIDPDANVNLNAGAFAAGAFAAGAIVSPDVNISGDLSVGDISGEVNLQVSEVSFDVSGGDINIDQSGATNNNTYNTTNNYYYDPSEPVEPEQEPFSIDYNEILSEGELESILNQETYEIVISTSDFDDVISVPDTIPDDVNELILLPSDVVSASSAVVGYGSQIISDLGLTPIYAPLALFSCFCWILRGGK